MRTIGRLTFILGAFGTLAGISATPAQAQATRTWVSGVGDDVNPCSRTAPCKTFAGAISKTAAGGEINCLDPGGFGAVTITKSMTISCPYTEGGALAGGNGIVINDSATATPNTAVVVIRGLDIFGVNPPSNGVRFIAGAALHIEDSVIRRFNAANSAGVSIAPGAAATVFITNTTISSNGNGATGGGIVVQPTGAGGTARVELRNVRVVGNANNGLFVNMTGSTSGTGVSVMIEDSQFSGNSSDGIEILQPAATQNVTMLINGSTLAHNSAVGLNGAGAGVLVHVDNSTITGNAQGLSSSSGAQLLSFGGNRLIRNPAHGAQANGAFTGPDVPRD